MVKRHCLWRNASSCSFSTSVGGRQGLICSSCPFCFLSFQPLSQASFRVWFQPRHSQAPRGHIPPPAHSLIRSHPPSSKSPSQLGIQLLPCLPAPGVFMSTPQCLPSLASNESSYLEVSPKLPGVKNQHLQLCPAVLQKVLSETDPRLLPSVPRFASYLLFQAVTVFLQVCLVLFLMKWTLVKSLLKAYFSLPVIPSERQRCAVRCRRSCPGPTPGGSYSVTSWCGRW